MGDLIYVRPAPSEVHNLEVSGEDLDTLLAALYHWLRTTAPEEREEDGIATRCNEHLPLSDTGVWDLIDRLSGRKD